MRYLVGRYDVSTRRACRVITTTRSSTYYTSRKDPLTALRQRMRELAQTRVRFGYRRLRVLLQREGWEVGNETFLPPLLRPQIANPMSFSPLSGPAWGPKITSASASFASGLRLSFGMIRTDTISPLPLDIGVLLDAPTM
jgi:hypothetical protein